jgi:hypothetical protein
MQTQTGEKQSRNGGAENGKAGLNHERTAVAAHELWRRRGSPEGSPDADWFEAERQLEEEKDREHLQAAH